ADLAQRLAERLRGWTGGQRWAVTVTNTGGAPTIAETREAEARAARDRALALPIVQQVLAAFPGATLTNVTRAAPRVEAVELAEGAANPHAGAEGPVAEVEEWDPFEDED
ncbi:MAG: DNA polymerase III subunit gamma/tau, partial [Alphaproteobacteria bacterium]|nr:DNA polymerase III subunit gamma/tau [Alphaproteobacteria bacterium]